jgi:Vibrio phage DNA polymerase
VAKSRPFVTLDCETDPFKVGRIPVPFIWGLYRYDTEEYWEFDTPAQVVEFLADKRWVCYAHNGGKFDYHYLRDDINSDDPLMVVAGRLARFRIGECEFRDSWNVLNEPLKVFAKEEFDYTKLEAEVRAQHRDEIKRYLKSDCVNLANTLADYFARYGRTLTQASASFKYWKKHFKVPFVPQTAVQSEYYRDFYYGGRVQCFESGHVYTDFSVVDINSAYPYAMLHQHPISPAGVLDDHLPTIEKMGPCMIRLSAVAKGCFPLRADNGELFFPYDETTVREYAITGWELAAALETNSVKIVNVREIRRFVHTVNFEEYINYFYELRLKAKANGDRLGDLFAKRFMNGLYGKFAANPEKYHEYLIASDDSLGDWHGKGFERIKPWGERHLMARDLPEEKQRYYNVATAASITGFVRAHLFKAIQKCSGVLYCDTDSIAAKDISSVPVGSELGKFKHEMSCTEYAIAGKKLYAFRGTDNKSPDPKWKVACKGVNLTPEQIVAVSEGQQILYTPEVPTYSFQRSEPIFINREVKNTFKDIRKVA